MNIQQRSEIQCVINHITGGYAEGGETSSVRKKPLKTIMAVEGTLTLKDQRPLP